MLTNFDNIIIDIGSYSVKSGFGEEKLPRFNTPINQIKTKNNSIDNKDSLTVLNHFSFVEETESDIHNKKEIISYIYQHELKVNPEDFNLLLIQNPNLSQNKRVSIFECLFEEVNVKSAFLPNQSILSVFSSGKSSGISLDIGEKKIYIQPVYEGYGIHQSCICSNFGGYDINKFLLKMLSERGINFNFSDPNKTITDIKERYGYISLEYENDLQNYSSKDEEFNSEYILPDQSVLKLGNEKFRCAEILFKPNLIGKKNLEGIHESLNKSINNIDFKKDDEDEERIKYELFNNIVISGGSSMFKGLEKRLENETNKISELNYCNVNTITERRFAAWIGGSIISAVSVFQSLWVTKEDYEEYGEDIISRKLI